MRFRLLLRKTRRNDEEELERPTLDDGAAAADLAAALECRPTGFEAAAAAARGGMLRR